MKKLFLSLSALGLLFNSCSNDDDNISNTPNLDIPEQYVSDNFNTNAATELTVIAELQAMTDEANAAEARAEQAQLAGTSVAEYTPITYPSTLESVTIDSYKNLVATWLLEIVKAANSPDSFQNPGLNGVPADGQEGGALGGPTGRIEDPYNSRLLDEYGLELEQMLQKGSFGAALYNHAITVVNAIKNGTETSSAAIDKLVAIYGASPAFDASSTAASQYAERRSNHEAQTGFFYDIKTSLITAKAAMEAGSNFNTQRNEALDAYLLDWEKSNFATVIFYCRATINLLNEASALEPGETNTQGQTREEIQGNALHAYAEGVAFAHGFKGISNKTITDAQIDTILENLLAPEGQNPESYKFLNDNSLLTNLEDIIRNIQTIYEFSDDEVNSFYSNNNL